MADVPEKPRDKHNDDGLPRPQVRFDGKSYTQEEPPPRKLPRYTPDDLHFEEDSLGRKFFYTPEGRAVCGRPKKVKNRAIENEACLGIPTSYGPCRVHGAHGGAPMRRGGRYSRVLKRWRRNFDRALADSDMIDTRPEVAMMDALIEKLVARVEQGDSPSWREDLKRAFDELEAAVKGRRQKDVAEILRRLGALIHDGARLDQVAGDLNRELERRAKRAEKIAELRIRRAEKITTQDFDAAILAWVAKLEDLLPDHEFPKVVQAMAAMRKDLEFLGADLSRYPGLDLK